MRSVSHNVTIIVLSMKSVAMEVMMKMDVNCLAGVLERERAVLMDIV